MKRKTSAIFFFLIGVILVLFFFPLVEGFEDCMVDTLATMKNQIAELRKDVDALKTPTLDQTSDVANSQLAGKTDQTYSELNNNLSDPTI
jgi:hypothetical protein